MWKKLPNSDSLFISFVENDGYYVYVTDFIKIWWVHYKGKKFVGILKEYNEHLEMQNDEEFLQLGLKMLSEPEKLKKFQIYFEDEACNVSMTLSCGFSTYLSMQLTEGSKEMFFKKTTEQLLKTVHDLKASESELRLLLTKKDDEMEEDKSETDELAMYLKTGVFHEEEPTSTHTVNKKHFGTSELLNSILKKALDSPEDQVFVKHKKQVEETNVKVEPACQEAVKSEPDSLNESESQNLSCSALVKREIKNDPYISPKRKHRKVLKM